MTTIAFNLILILLITSLFIFFRLSLDVQHKIQLPFWTLVLLIILSITNIISNPSIHLDSTTTLSDLQANTALVEDKAFLLDQALDLLTSPSLFYSILFYLFYKLGLIGSVKLIEVKHDSGKSWSTLIKSWIDYIKDRIGYLRRFSFLALFSIFTRPFKSKSNNEYKYKWLEPRNRFTTYHERPSIHSSSTESDASFYVRAFNNNEVTTIEEAEQVRMMLKLLELRGQMVNDVEVLDFLNDFGNYTRSSRVRTSVLSMRRSIASSIDPFNRFDINKQLPPLPHTQHIRDIEIMNTELARFINAKYGIHPSTLPVILEEPENNNWDMWSYTPFFLLNIDLRDLSIEDYNIWCNIHTPIFLREKQLPLMEPLIPLPDHYLAVNKDLPSLPILDINSPYEPFTDCLILGDINLYLTNHNIWTLLIIILALLFFWILPFYLLIKGNISKQEITIGYINIKGYLLNHIITLFKWIRNILRRMLYRWILTVILLILIYLFNLQNYIPTMIINKLTSSALDTNFDERLLPELETASEDFTEEAQSEETNNNYLALIIFPITVSLIAIVGGICDLHLDNLLLIETVEELLVAGLEQAYKTEVVASNLYG